MDVAPVFSCHRISYSRRIKLPVLTTLARFPEQSGGSPKG
ncbi:hypothetical protein APT_00387 [Acetobacter pasteurianus NBRC 101655]|nr:hypothetical protein APT_00387 [Acetobacter pasteurianus NBRC 101655]CCT59971.1 hypothetical protein APA386B_1906 [Acetobacter pasteurianus 386B]